MQRLLIACIRFYRHYISPLMAPHCRFYPTCSQYAVEAIQQHGAARGTFLSVKRLCKCHPLHPGGYDPVPDCKHHQSDTNTNHQAS